MTKKCLHCFYPNEFTNNLKSKNNFWMYLLRRSKIVFYLIRFTNSHSGLRYWLFSIRLKIGPMLESSHLKGRELKTQTPNSINRLFLYSGESILQNGYKIYRFQCIWEKNQNEIHKDPLYYFKTKPAYKGIFSSSNTGINLKSKFKSTLCHFIYETIKK